MSEYESVWLYGAGGFGVRLKADLQDAGIQVTGVIDARGSDSGDPTAMRLEDVPPSASKLPVFIGVFNHFTNLHELAQQLRGRGFEKILCPPQIYELLARRGILRQTYWLSDAGSMIPPAESIHHLRTLLADPESRRLLDGLIAYREGQNLPRSLTPRALTLQYCEPTLGSKDHFRGTVIDCGAYTGDSIANWAQQGLSCNLLIALEPNLANFSQLVGNATSSSMPVVTLPLGVSSSTGRHSVVGDGASSQLIRSETGDVTAVCLDDLCESIDVNFIKMDIEGGEWDALHGAVSVIKRSSPYLAISIYHRPADLWRIPLYLHELNPGYVFSLRVYGHQGYDTVLYAQPPVQ